MISNDLIRDTLNLVTLAREAALAQGEQDQAIRLVPVIEGLHDLVTSAPTSQSDLHGFKSIVDDESVPSFSETFSELGRISATQTPLGNSQAVVDMVASGMSEIDIARQLGMAREQVRLITNLRRQSPSGKRHEDD